MKKRIFVSLICCFFILGLTGCGALKNKFDIGEKSDIEILEKGVTLAVKENTLTKTSATLILKNNNDVDIQLGDSYEIEIKKDGKWHKINVQLNFNSPAYVLKSNESREIEIDWKNAYGKLVKGEYRIIKSIGIKNNNETFDDFYVSAEFIIK